MQAWSDYEQYALRTFHFAYVHIVFNVFFSTPKDVIFSLESPWHNRFVTFGCRDCGNLRTSVNCNGVIWRVGNVVTEKHTLNKAK